MDPQKDASESQKREGPLWSLAQPFFWSVPIAGYIWTLLPEQYQPALLWHVAKAIAVFWAWGVASFFAVFICDGFNRALVAKEDAKQIGAPAAITLVIVLIGIWTLTK